MSSSPGTEESLPFDQEGNQNSTDSFEKQLEQQERELQEQLRLQEEEQQEQEAVKPAEDQDAIPTPVAAPTTMMWQQDNNGAEDMAVDDAADESISLLDASDNTQLSGGGVKRPSTTSQENGDEAAEDEDKQPQSKQRKVDELTKLWTGVHDNPKDFQAWTNLLQHIDQQSELESGREAYGSFFSSYPYCYGYWKKFADLEKRKGTKESTLKVFERGIAAIPLSVDLWVHYMDYIVNTFKEDTEEDFVREQFERAVTSSGLEFRSDKIWDAYINWENNGKRFALVTGVYDRLLATPVAKYLQHWTRFQEHVKRHQSSEVISSEEFVTLRRSLSADAPQTEDGATVDEAPPGVEDDASGAADAAAAAVLLAASEEENKSIQQLIIGAREKIHTSTIDEVKQRWSYEDAIKRPYFHVKPLERSQLQAWRDYLEFEVKQGNEKRTRTLFERCLIAAALYEEFWMRYLHYLETLSGVTDEEIRAVYERACNIHLKEKLKPHLSWANFEEEKGNVPRALELLSELQTRLPEALEPHLQAVAIERRRGNLPQAEKLFLTSIEVFKSSEKVSSAYVNMIVRYARFLCLFCGQSEKAVDYIQTVIDEHSTSTGKLSDSEQQCVETLLWAVIERAMGCTPPKFEVVVKSLNLGTTAQFSSRTRLLFAHRYNQFVAECGSSDITVSEATKLLRELQQELRQSSQEENLEAASSDKADDSMDAQSGDGRREKRSKSTGGGDKSHQPPPGHAHQNGGGNMSQHNNSYNNQNTGGGGGGGYHNQQPPQQQQQQHYPPQNSGGGGGGGPPHQPPQHPPPQNQGGYGGYNQNYQQGYPPQQYQGWGYPQQQQGYGYNQQNWGTGYPNYYGQR